MQPFEQTRDLVEAVRNAGISSAGVDLIYGLPLQTPRSFERTVDRAVQGTERTAKRAGKFVEKTATRAGKFVERTATKVEKSVKRAVE